MSKKCDDKKWLSTLKVGDEVCIIDILSKLYAYTNTDMLASNNEICEVAEVTAITEDNIIVGSLVFSKDGSLVLASPQSVFYINNSSIKIVPVTEGLREKAWNLSYNKLLHSVNWNNVSLDCKSNIIKLVTADIREHDASNRKVSKDELCTMEK